MKQPTMEALSLYATLFHKEQAAQLIRPQHSKTHRETEMAHNALSVTLANAHARGVLSSIIQHRQETATYSILSFKHYSGECKN